MKFESSGQTLNPLLLFELTVSLIKVYKLQCIPAAVRNLRHAQRDERMLKQFWFSS